MFSCFIDTFSAKTPEAHDTFPSNCKDFIDPIMLEKYQGKPQLGLNDEDYFQGDIREVEKNIPPKELKRGLNNVIAITDKR